MLSKCKITFPASYFISLISSPILLTLLMDERQTECVVNTAVYIPGIARNSFMYLAIDCELMGLND